MPIIDKTLAGDGLNLWHGKEAEARQRFEAKIADYLNRQGCQRVYTPHVCLFNERVKKPWPPARQEDGHVYQYLPPKWPFHLIVANEEPLSYKDLPVILYEIGELYSRPKGTELIVNVPGVTLTGVNAEAELLFRRFQEFFDGISVLTDEVSITSQVASRWELLEEYQYVTKDNTKANLCMVAMNVKWWPKCESTPPTS